MKYWQHAEPLRCPKDHPMVWLGTSYWICGKCKQVYVADNTKFHERGSAVDSVDSPTRSDP